MNIEKAIELKIGDKVRCPSDRGDPPFIGCVYDAPRGGVNVTANGVEYVWVTIEHNGKRSVWPSNRISKV